MSKEFTANGQHPVVVAVKTADFDIEAIDNGKAFANTAASGTVVFNLPAAEVGMRFGFRVMAAQAIRINPDGTETIGLPSSGAQGAAGKYLTADAVGEWLNIECVKAGEWFVVGYAGTWAHEA